VRQAIRYVKTDYANAFVTIRFPGFPAEIVCSSIYHPIETGDFMPGPDGRIYRVFAKTHGFIKKGSSTPRICPEYLMSRMPIDFDPIEAAASLSCE
jgi:hypothetical protein